MVRGRCPLMEPFVNLRIVITREFPEHIGVVR